MNKQPQLRMIAGPNGSGKSTLLNYLAENFDFPFGFCLNPDELDQELRLYGRLYLGSFGARIREADLRSFIDAHPLSDRLALPPPVLDGKVLTISPGYQTGYFITILCDFLRQQWLAASESFTFETVMSHEGKVDLLRGARTKGYRIYLYYICTDNIVINRERVAGRAAQGGHDVPIEKIESRYRRSLALLPQILSETNRTYLFDNSGQSHRLIAEFESVRLMNVVSDPPAWFVDTLAKL